MSDFFPMYLAMSGKARTRLQISVSSGSKGNRFSHYALLLSFDYGSNDVKSPDIVALTLQYVFFFHTTKQLQSDTVFLEVAPDPTTLVLQDYIPHFICQLQVRIVTAFDNLL